MELISLGNHIIRKALLLSLNEMAVLCDVLKMSQNPKYGNWCVKSKKKMAEWLDLSEDTIFKILKTLEVKKYIERSDIGVRPSDFIYNLNLCQEEIGIAIKNNDIALISAKIKELYPSDTLSEKPSIVSEIPIPPLSEKPILDNNSSLEEKRDNNDFDFFWSLYPNKVAKEKCLAKWKKLSKSDIEKILTTIKDFINNKPFETYNHPNPLTYLNQARWNDEIVKKGTKNLFSVPEDQTKEKVYFRWKGEGNSIQLREIEKDKSYEYFKKAEEGGWIPVFYNKN